MIKNFYSRKAKAYNPPVGDLVTKLYGTTTTTRAVRCFIFESQTPNCPKIVPSIIRPAQDNKRATAVQERECLLKQTAIAIVLDLKGKHDSETKLLNPTC